MLNIKVLILESKHDLSSLSLSLKNRVRNLILVKNSKEAIEIMKNNDIDIVLTDLEPYIDDSLEVVRYAINHHTPIIPAVIVSEYKEFLKQWNGIPYIRVLHKPYNCDILYENILSVLQTSDDDLSENYCDTINDICDSAENLLKTLNNNY